MGTGNYLDMLLSGLVLTIETALLAWIIALVTGSIVGVLRTLPSKTASWIRIILPPLTSEFLNTIKNTAVAITIGLIELTGQARSMQEFSFQVFEAFTAATVIYLLINFVVVTGMRLLERRVAIPGYISGK